MLYIASITRQLCWLMSFVLFFTWSGLPGYLAYAQDPPRKVSYEEAQKRIDDFFQPFEELQAELDKTAFDVEAKAKALGRDMQAIFEFVRDQVRYESYVGILRGARGTLIGLAGNSLDQSLLLAELLRHNGFQVQFVRGMLDEATTKRLIEEMLQRPVAPVNKQSVDLPQSSHQIGDAGLSQEEYQKVITTQEMERQTFLEDLLESVQTDFQAIKSALQEQNIILGGDRETEEAQLLAETKDHFWVQVQQQGQWIDLDPSFRGAQPGASFTSGTVMTEIPDTFHHTFTIEITVEQKKGARLLRQTALSKSFKVADIAVSNLQFANVPNNADAGLERLDQATRFLPVLAINGTLFYDRGFDLRGNLIPAAAFTSGPGQLGGDISGSFGRMPELLPGMGGEQGEKASLTGEWISFIVQGPTGEKRIYDRELLDRIGIENRAGTGAKQVSPRYRDEKKVKYTLLTSRRILINSFRLNQTFLLDRFGTQVLAKRPVLNQTLKFAFQKESTDFQKVSKEMAQSSRIDLPLLLLLLMQGSEVFAQLLALNRDATPVFYSDRPSIFLYKNNLELNSQGRILAQEGIDIVENALRVISTRGTTAVNAEFHLLIGLGQAHLERALVKLWNGGAIALESLEQAVKGWEECGPLTRPMCSLKPEDRADSRSSSHRKASKLCILSN